MKLHLALGIGALALFLIGLAMRRAFRSTGAQLIAQSCSHANKPQE